MSILPVLEQMPLRDQEVYKSLSDQFPSVNFLQSVIAIKVSLRNPVKGPHATLVLFFSYLSNEMFFEILFSFLLLLQIPC